MQLQKFARIIFLTILSFSARQNVLSKSSPFFDIRLKKGDRLGTLFSRSISIAGDSIQEVTYRISGSGVYTVTDPSPDTTIFNAIFRYDGRPSTFDTVSISRHGNYISDNGNLNPNTDASGLTFNEFLWGHIPEKIHAGDSWKVEINHAWELGGPGTETVIVMETDLINHTIKLKRDGFGTGFFENDIHQIGVTLKTGKSIHVNIDPGEAHWSGYTIFKNGIVISDELMVTRPVTLITEGISYQALQREYILLNGMPVENY